MWRWVKIKWVKMKQLILASVLVLCISCNSQKRKVTESTIIISQNTKNIKGIQLVLNPIINDSRCPEGTNCVWAGKVDLVISVLKNNIVTATEKLEIKSQNDKKNLHWFSKFYPDKTIKSISVKPFPKEGVIINRDDYFIELKF